MYSVVGSNDDRTAYPNWSFDRTLQALWEWRRVEWGKDQEWRGKAGLGASLEIERWLALRPFGATIVVGEQVELFAA